MPCLCFSISSFFSRYFSPFLTTALKKCMFVLLTHIAVTVCSIYTLLVNKAVQVDVLTDGKMGSRETETERGDNHRGPHSSAWPGRQMKKWRWKGDDMEKICVHLCILYSQRLTQHLHTLTSLSPIAQMGADMQADGKTRRRVCRLLCSCRGCCLCVH